MKTGGHGGDSAWEACVHGRGVRGHRVRAYREVTGSGPTLQGGHRVRVYTAGRSQGQSLHCSGVKGHRVRAHTAGRSQGQSLHCSGVTGSGPTLQPWCPLIQGRGQVSNLPRGTCGLELVTLPPPPLTVEVTGVYHTGLCSAGVEPGFLCAN